MIGGDFLQRISQAQKWIVPIAIASSTHLIQPGTTIRYVDECPKSELYKKQCLLQIIDKQILIKSSEAKTDEADVAATSSISAKHVIEATSQILEESPDSRKWYLNSYDLPTGNCETLRDWLISQREQFTKKTIQAGFTSAKLLIKAMKELHSRHSYLMDLTLSESIFVAKDSSFRLLALKHTSNGQYDRQCIYAKYLASLKLQDPFDLFLYPPEMLEAAASLAEDDNLKRKVKGDVWTFGVILLLLLGCHESEIGVMIQSKNFPRFFATGKINELMQNLFVSLFEKIPRNRPTFVEIGQSISQIRKLNHSLKEKTIGDDADDNDEESDIDASDSAEENNAPQEEAESRSKDEKSPKVTAEEKAEKTSPEEVPLASKTPLVVETSTAAAAATATVLSAEDTAKMQTKRIQKLIVKLKLEEATDQLNRLQNERQLTETELALFGKILFARSIIPQAIIYLKKTIAVNPFHSDSLHLLGLISLQRNQLEESAEFFKRSYSANVLRQDSVFQLGEIALLQKCPKEAIRLFEQCLVDTKNNTNPLLLYKLSLAYRRDTRYKEAVSVLEKIMHYRKEYGTEYRAAAKTVSDIRLAAIKLAISSTGETQELLMELVSVYKSKKQYKQAVEVLNDVTMSYPDMQKESVQLWLDFGECYTEMNDMKGALESLLEGLKVMVSLECKGNPLSSTVVSPIKYRLFSALGAVYAKASKQREKAIHWYLESIKHAENTTYRNKNLGCALEILKPIIDRRLARFDQFDADHPDEESVKLEEYARCYQYSVNVGEEISKIKAIYTTALIEGVGAAKVFRCCGLRSLYAGDYSNAKSCFKVMRIIDPFDLALQFDEAVATAESGRHKQAKQKFNEVIKVRNQSTITTTANQYLSKKQIRMKNRFAAVRVRSEMVLLSAPSPLDQLRSQMYYNQSLIETNAEEAFRLSKLCLEIDAKNADCWCNVASIFNSLKMVESAAECMQVCYSIDKYHLRMRVIEKEIGSASGYSYAIIEDLNLKHLEAVGYKSALQELLEGNYIGAHKWLSVCLSANPSNVEIKGMEKKVKRIKEKSKLAGVFRDSLKTMAVEQVLEHFHCDEEEGVSAADKRDGERDENDGSRSGNSNNKPKGVSAAEYGYTEMKEGEFIEQIEQISSWSLTFKSSIDALKIGDNLGALSGLNQFFEKTPSSFACLMLINIHRFQNTIDNLKQEMYLRIGLRLLKENQVNLRFNILVSFAQLLQQIHTKDSAQNEEIISLIEEAKKIYTEQLTTEKAEQDLTAFEKNSRETMCFKLAVLYLNNRNKSQCEAFTKKCLEFSPSSLMNQFLSEMAKVIFSGTDIKSTSNVVFDSLVNAVYKIGSRVVALNSVIPEGLARYFDCLLFKPSHTDCLGLCLYQRALTAQKQKKSDEAKDILVRACSTVPAFMPYSLALLDALNLVEKNTKVYEKAISLLLEMPTYKNALRFAGSSCTKRGKYVFAMHFFTRFLDVDADSDVEKMRIEKLAEGSNFEFTDESKYHLLSLTAASRFSRDTLTDEELEVILLVGDSFQGQGDIQSAVSVYKSAVELYPTHLEALMQIAKLNFQLEDIDGSLEAVFKCLELNPDHSESNFILGKILIRQSKYTAALKAFRRCVKNVPGHSQAYGCIGDCILLCDTKDIDLAESAYRKQVRVNPKHLRSLLQVGHFLLKKNNKKEAAQMFNQALQCSGNDQKEFCYEQVIAFYKQNNPTEKYIKILKSQAADFPHKLLANQLEIARLYKTKLNKPEEAITIWNSIQGVDSQLKAKLCYEIGETYEQHLNKSIEAIEYYCLALELNKDMYEAHYRLSKLYESANPESALKHSYKGLELNSNAQVFFRVGVLQKQLKCYEKALEAFSSYLEMCDIGQTAIYQYLGEVYEKLNLLEESSACYRVNFELLKGQSSEIQARQAYGGVLFKLKQYKLVVDILVGDDNSRLEGIRTAKLTFIIGESCYMSGQFSKSITAFSSIFVHYTSDQYFIPCIKRIIFYFYTHHITTATLCSAIEYFRDHIKKGESYSKDKLAEVEYLLALGYLALSNYSKADLSFKAAETYNPKYGRLPILKAKLTLLVYNDFKKAQAELDETPTIYKTENLFCVVQWEIYMKAKQFGKLKEGIDTFDFVKAETWMSTYRNYFTAVLLIQKDLIFKDDLLLKLDEKQISNEKMAKEVQEAEDLLIKSDHSDSDLLQALILIRKGQVALAKEKIDAILKAKPNFIDGLRVQYKIFLNEKNFKAALVPLSRLLDFVKNDIIGHNDLARSYIELKQFNEAVNQLEKSISIDPDNEETLLLLIEANALGNKHSTTIRMAKQYLELHPQNLQVLQILAKEYYLTNDFVNAKECLKPVLAQKVTPRENVVLLGSIYAAERNLPELKIIFNRILADFADSEETLSLQLGTWAKQFKDYTLANKYLSAYLIKNPGNIDCLEELVQMNLDLGQKEELKETLAKVTNAKFKNIDIVIAIGEFYINCGDMPEASKWLETADKERAMNSIDLQYLCALTKYSTKEFSRASMYILRCEKILESVSSAISLSSKFTESDLWYLRAAIAQNRGDTMERIHKQFLKIEGIKTNAEIILAEIEIELNNIPAAQAIYAKHCKTNHSQRMKLIEHSIEEEMFNQLDEATKTARKQEHLKRMQQLLEDCLKTHEECEYTSALLGFNQFEQGNEEEGTKHLAQALVLSLQPLKSPNDKPLTKEFMIRIYSQLAQSELNQSKFEEALGLIKKALQIQPNQTSLQNLAAKIETQIPKHEIDAVTRLNAMINAKQANFESYHIFGLLRYKQGYMDNALIHFRKCLQLDVQHIQVNNMVAEITEKAFKYVEAHDSYQRLLAADPTNTTYLMKLASILFSQEKFEALDNIINKYIAIQPNMDYETMVIQARSLNKRSRFVEAIEVYKQVKRIYSEKLNGQVTLSMAAAYQQLKDNQNEIICYKEIIDKKGLDLSRETLRRVRMNLANVYAYQGEFKLAQTTLIGDDIENLKPEGYGNLALFYIADGKYNDALKTANKALDKDQFNKHALFFMGFAYSKLGEISAAMKGYQYCLESHPSFLPAAINLALLQRKSNKHANAASKTLFTIQEHHAKNLLLTYHVALTYVYANSPNQAVRVLQEAIADYADRLKVTQANIQNSQTSEFQRCFKQHLRESVVVDEFAHDSLEVVQNYVPKDSNCPDLVQLNLLLAHCLRRAKQYDEATLLLSRCLDSDVMNYYYAYSLAYTHYLNGEIIDAEQEINRCRVLNAKSEEVYCFALSNMIHNSKGRDTESQELRMLYECIRIDQNYALAYQNIGFVHMSQKEYGLAFSAFEKYLELEPNHADAYFNLGNALLYLGRKDEAIKLLGQCLHYYNNHYQCNFNLGVIHMASGQISTAIYYFERCLEINPRERESYQQKLHYLYKLRILESR